MEILEFWKVVKVAHKHLGVRRGTKVVQNAFNRIMDDPSKWKDVDGLFSDDWIEISKVCGYEELKEIVKFLIELKFQKLLTIDKYLEAIENLELDLE